MDYMLTASEVVKRNTFRARCDMIQNASFDGLKPGQAKCVRRLLKHIHRRCNDEGIFQGRQSWLSDDLEVSERTIRNWIKWAKPWLLAHVVTSHYGSKSTKYAILWSQIAPGIDTNAVPKEDGHYRVTEPATVADRTGNGCRPNRQRLPVPIDPVLDPYKSRSKSDLQSSFQSPGKSLAGQLAAEARYRGKHGQDIAKVARAVELGLVSESVARDAARATGSQQRKSPVGYFMRCVAKVVTGGDVGALHRLIESSNANTCLPAAAVSNSTVMPADSYTAAQQHSARMKVLQTLERMG